MLSIYTTVPSECVSVCGVWECPRCSSPADTQLAIDGRTLRAVQEQPGRQAATKLLQTSLETGNPSDVAVRRFHSGMETSLFSRVRDALLADASQLRNPFFISQGLV